MEVNNLSSSVNEVKDDSLVIYYFGMTVVSHMMMMIKPSAQIICTWLYWTHDDLTITRWQDAILHHPTRLLKTTVFSTCSEQKKSSNIFKVLQTAWKKKIKQVKILFKTNKQNKTPQKIKNKTPLSEAGRKKFNQNFHSLLRHWHARHLLANQSYSVSAVGQKTWKPATKPRVIWRHSSPDGRRLKM